MYPSCQKNTALPQDLNQQDLDAAQDALVHGFLVCWVLVGTKVSTATTKIRPVT